MTDTLPSWATEKARLKRALTRAEDGAGTLPAKESVKLVPAHWHALQDAIRRLDEVQDA